MTTEQQSLIDAKLICEIVPKMGAELDKMRAALAVLIVCAALAPLAAVLAVLAARI